MLTELRRPRALVDGDVVRVVAPSGPIDPDRLQAGAHLLESWGLQVEVGEHVLGRTRHGYLAGSDAERASDFVRAWCDPTVAAVLCARGGYGVHRMLDLVDWSALRAARHDDPPPALVGFSDVTALHEAVGVELGVASLLGPMAASYRFHEDEASQQHLRDTLFGKDPGPVGGDDVRTLVPGAADGVTAGGTLTLLAASVGGRSARRSLAGALLVLEDVDEPTYRLDRALTQLRRAGVTAGGTLTLLAASVGGRSARRSLAGALLVLEDVDEPTYRLDRALTQLRRAGVLDDVAGVVGGRWVECGDPDSIDELLLDRLGGLGVPMVNGVDVGHGLRHLTVPLGVAGRLDADRGVLVPGAATSG